MRQQIWTNLQLLDFGSFHQKQSHHHAHKQSATKAEHHVTVKEAPLDAGSDQYFAAIANNNSIAQKSMESVFWFLFHQLSPAEAQEKFRGCFPVYDRQSQGREFRSQAVKWLEQLKRDSKLPQDLMIRKSYFDECRGERYERTLLALSDLVLRQAMEATGLFNKELAFLRLAAEGGESKQEIATRLKEMHDKASAELEEFVKKRNGEEDRWKRHASRVQHRHAELLERKAELEAAKARISASSQQKQVDPKMYQRLTELWKRMGERLNDKHFLQRQRSLQSVLAKEEESRSASEKPFIDGKALMEQLQIGDRFAHTWSRLMQQHSIAPITRRDGESQLDLLAVFRLWKIVVCARLSELGYLPDDIMQTADNCSAMLKQIINGVASFRRSEPISVDQLMAQSKETTALLERMEGLLENLQELSRSLQDRLQNGVDDRQSGLAVPREQLLVRIEVTPLTVPALSFHQPTVSRKARPPKSPALVADGAGGKRLTISPLFQSADSRRTSLASQLQETPARINAALAPSSDMTALKSRLKELRERRQSTSPIGSSKVVVVDERDQSFAHVHNENTVDRQQQVVINHFCDQIANHAIGEDTIDATKQKQQGYHAVRNPLEALNVNTAFQSRSRLKNTPPPSRPAVNRDFAAIRTAADTMKTPLRNMLRQSADNSVEYSPQLLSPYRADQSMMDPALFEPSQMLDDIKIQLI